MNNYKSLEKYLGKSRDNSKSNVSHFTFYFLSKVLICFILFLLFLISSKCFSSFKENFYDVVYNNSLSFSKFRTLYEEKFGNLFPINNPNVTPTFDEKLSYESSNLYHDGVALKVSQNYLVPAIKSGVVIFIGDKNDYGSTVIVQGEDGVDIWYSNIVVGDLKMYDFVNEGSYIGEAKDEKLYLVFQKKGDFLDYKEFI